jgi:hypothetical protein
MVQRIIGRERQRRESSAALSRFTCAAKPSLGELKKADDFAGSAVCPRVASCDQGAKKASVITAPCKAEQSRSCFVSADIIQPPGSCFRHAPRLRGGYCRRQRRSSYTDHQLSYVARSRTHGTFVAASEKSDSLKPDSFKIAFDRSASAKRPVIRAPVKSVSRRSARTNEH